MVRKNKTLPSRAEMVKATLEAICSLPSIDKAVNDSPKSVEIQRQIDAFIRKLDGSKPQYYQLYYLLIKIGVSWNEAQDWIDHWMKSPSEPSHVTKERIKLIQELDDGKYDSQIQSKITGISANSEQVNYHFLLLIGFKHHPSMLRLHEKLVEKKLPDEYIHTVIKRMINMDAEDSKSIENTINEMILKLNLVQLPGKEAVSVLEKDGFIRLEYLKDFESALKHLKLNDDELVSDALLQANNFNQSEVKRLTADLQRHFIKPGRIGARARFWLREYLDYQTGIMRVDKNCKALLKLEDTLIKYGASTSLCSQVITNAIRQTAASVNGVEFTDIEIIKRACKLLDELAYAGVKGQRLDEFLKGAHFSFDDKGRFYIRLIKNFGLEEGAHERTSPHYQDLKAKAMKDGKTYCHEVSIQCGEILPELLLIKTDLDSGGRPHIKTHFQAEPASPVASSISGSAIRKATSFIYALDTGMRASTRVIGSSIIGSVNQASTPYLNHGPYGRSEYIEEKPITRDASGVFNIDETSHDKLREIALARLEAALEKSGASKTIREQVMQHARSQVKQLVDHVLTEPHIIIERAAKLFDIAIDEGIIGARFDQFLYGGHFTFDDGGRFVDRLLNEFNLDYERNERISSHHHNIPNGEKDKEFGIRFGAIVPELLVIRTKHNSPDEGGNPSFCSNFQTENSPFHSGRHRDSAQHTLDSLNYAKGKAKGVLFRTIGKAVGSKVLQQTVIYNLGPYGWSPHDDGSPVRRNSDGAWNVRAQPDNELEAIMVIMQDEAGNKQCLEEYSLCTSFDQTTQPLGTPASASAQLPLGLSQPHTLQQRLRELELQQRSDRNAPPTHEPTKPAEPSSPSFGRGKDE